MNELIKIEENEQGQSVVSARNLYHFLGVTERFQSWCTRNFEYGFDENEDFTSVKTFTLVNNGAKKEIQDYALTLDCAKEISMIQRNAKGKEARKYFIEVEKQFRKLEVKPSLPTTYLQALEVLIKTEKEKQLLQLKTENLQIALDNDLKWCSIIKVSSHNKIKESQLNWRVLKSMSEKMGFDVRRMPSKRYLYQNTYHVSVFCACYPELNYDFIQNK